LLKLLTGLRRGGFLVHLGLVRFVVAHCASRGGAELAMACYVSGNPTDNGALDTAFGIR
jgi:hypothetical protein